MTLARAIICTGKVVGQQRSGVHSDEISRDIATQSPSRAVIYREMSFRIARVGFAKEVNELLGAAAEVGAATNKESSTVPEDVNE